MPMNADQRHCMNGPVSGKGHLMGQRTVWQKRLAIRFAERQVFFSRFILLTTVDTAIGRREAR